MNLSNINQENVFVKSIIDNEEKGDLVSINKNNIYLCAMKKEFGKWLMDIAKYITTSYPYFHIRRDRTEMDYLCRRYRFYIINTRYRALARSG